MGRLDGQVAIVTGAGSGIGRATALLLAGEGATVVAAGRRRAPLERTRCPAETAPTPGAPSRRTMPPTGGAAIASAATGPLVLMPARAAGLRLQQRLARTEA